MRVPTDAMTSTDVDHGTKVRVSSGVSTKALTFVECEAVMATPNDPDWLPGSASTKEFNGRWNRALDFVPGGITTRTFPLSSLTVNEKFDVSSRVIRRVLL